MSVVSIKTRWLWALFLLLVLGVSVVAVKSYLVVSPGLAVDITFSRAEALTAAETFQQEYFPDLKTERRALAFISDRHLQNYVELEGGGLAVYQELIPELDAVTHYWKLRSFSEGQQEELILAFSPQGEFISYFLIIPNEAPGAALAEAEARALAEAGARQHIGERFDAYKPLETRVVRQSTGRADYSFTYEHSSLQVGEARFRIELKVAGDQLVGLDTFKHIPEAFNQRFGEMRGLNSQISQIANYLMGALMGLGGLVAGGIWLFRRHQLRWLPALVPALVVSGGMAAATLCSMPASWMGYRTTDTVNNFLLQQGYQATMILVAFGLGLSVIFAVAEGLSRMAFAHHPRLYDAWRTPVAGTPEIAGRILGGYAWAGCFLAYAMLFILLSTRVLGWWSPSGMHSDPNILASWRPALGPIFTALQAGTWEECLFRAIPLSMAILLGRHFNILKPLVITTLILQALIFAGAHADYPQLPGYSRLIELFIPALAFGLVFLRFGLIPSMLSHFIYDLVLMSVPVFMATDTSLWIDRSLVIAVGVLPLVVLMYAYWRQGGWQVLGAQWRNGEPPLPDASIESTASTQESIAVVRPLHVGSGWLLVAALISMSVIAFNWFKPKDIIWPMYQVDRAQAIQLAEAELAKRGVVLTGEWRRTALTSNGMGGKNSFVWRESGREVYQQLIGNHLDTPYWTITWRRFDGPVEERSEYWAAWLYPDGSLHELVHQLPEGSPGAHLTREEAVTVARNWLLALGWPDPQTLEEKAVEEIKRPERTDWSIRYLDRAVYDHKNGQAVIRVSLSGDEVTGYVRTIDVPQEWYRAEEEKNASRQPYSIAMGLAVTLITVLALCGFLGKSTGRRFRFKIALPWMLINSGAMLLVSFLWMDQMISQFDPKMAWSTQLWLRVAGLGLGAVVMALISFLAVQAIYAVHSNSFVPVNAGAVAKRDFWLGSSIGLVFVAFSASAELLLPSTVSAPGAYSADYATALPWLTTIGNGLKGIMGVMMTLVLALGMLRFATKLWRKVLVVVLILVWLVMGSLAAEEAGIVLLHNLIKLARIVLLIELLRRKQVAVAIAMGCASAALGQLAVGHALYASAWLHGLLSFLVCTGVSYGLVRHWHRYAADEPVTPVKAESTTEASKSLLAEESVR